MKNLILLVASFLLTSVVGAQTRVPRELWLQYADPAQAGFDPAALAAARETWEGMPSSAFMVIADGAVVAAWGQTERRFMCHSVRKSFLSALYGIYWDRGELELNKTLADLGLDDTPDPLLETEKQARILDLLKARSGVFHPAAYAGRTDSRPRGSEGPGRYFAYNNWDFNTLATILMKETGCDVFEAFDEHFGRPLGMEDWRVSDGYYHYERDKSKYPAYPFRLSARDAARFGLLFARGGLWGDERILSQHWVDRSRALYSIDDSVRGYGFMWWVFRQSPFVDHGMYSALGVGNQMIAVLPESDLVIVNRANTYEREGTPDTQLLALVTQILDARRGTPVADPELVPMSVEVREPTLEAASLERLGEYVGDWDLPARELGIETQSSVRVELDGERLVGRWENRGTFGLQLQPDGSLFVEDAHDWLFPIRKASGELAGLAGEGAIVGASLMALAEGDSDGAAEWMALLDNVSTSHVEVGRALLGFIRGETRTAVRSLEALKKSIGGEEVEARANVIGYEFFQAEQYDLARSVFELVTELFPSSANAWDSLAEAHMRLGHDDEAIAFYERSLELDASNANAKAMIERILQGEAAR